jgi:hypothetical protein
MRTVIIALLVTTLAFEGCSSLYQSSRPIAFSQENLKEINSTLENRPSTIWMKNGSITKASSVFITKDSTFWHDSTLALGRTIPNTGIDRLCTIDHPRGGVDGLTIGVGVGLTILVGGVVAGKLIDKDRGSDYAFLLAGIAAIPICLIVGSAIGHSDYFIYPKDSLMIQGESTVSESRDIDK